MSTQLCFVCYKNAGIEGERINADVQCKGCGGAALNGFLVKDLDPFTLKRLQRLQKERIEAIQQLVALVICEKTGAHPIPMGSVQLNLAMAGAGICDCKTCLVFYNGFLAGMTKAVMLVEGCGVCAQKIAVVAGGKQSTTYEA